MADLNLLVFEPLGMIESRNMKNEIGMCMYKKIIKIINNISLKIHYYLSKIVHRYLNHGHLQLT